VRASEADSRRPIFTIEFKPESWVEDPTRALKALLKVALRRFRLRRPLCRDETGRASGPLGTALDLTAEGE
jgi:hypothetical protein